MYGAVLWTDQGSDRALIWCEDQGNLAFFDGYENGFPPSFEAGDLVKFKVMDGRGMRLAFDVEVVATEEYPYLADGLKGTPAPRDSAAAPAPKARERKILPFVKGAPEPAQGSDRMSAASSCQPAEILLFR